jgi:hydroxymethylglutaryl-CoA lyase
MRDTAEVLSQLELENNPTKLLAIVANSRGAEDAATFPEIDYLGYPFSISETFQLRNTNATIQESLDRVKQIQDICLQSNKELVIYISMGFGNPYGDPWNAEIVKTWVDQLQALDIHIFQLSDTIGVATPQSIRYIFSELIGAYPALEFGAHFHTVPALWHEKIDAAYKSGCRRFDGAIKGYGGCPMAKDDLTGNMPTENMIAYFHEAEDPTGINLEILLRALAKAQEVFPAH